jgi:uncharacterized protein YecT (DUF1311 family)
MHTLEKHLEQLNSDLLQVTREAYASYEDNQPGYLKDVGQFLAEADRTWRVYRDATCNLEPFIQGMSRSEAVDLTEACRANTTAARLDAIEVILRRLRSIATERTHSTS